MHVSFIASLAMVFSAGATGEEYKCTNDHLAEVQCVGTKCELKTDGFTSLRVLLKEHSMEICAYSACFSGITDVAELKDPHFIYSAAVARVQGGCCSAGGEAADRLSVIFDRDDGFGAVRWRGFATPVYCTVWIPPFTSPAPGRP